MPAVGAAPPGAAGFRHSRSSDPLSFEDRRDGALHILRSGCPAADADPHRSTPTPGRAAAPAGAGILDAGDDATGPVIVSERHHDLIEHHLVQDFDTCFR